MYTEKDRDSLLERTRDFMEQRPEFEGLLQIGSGASDYADIYSDIDLMAGCCENACLPKTEAYLIEFFNSLGAVYIDRRCWSDSVLGLSVYFKDGLSIDLSFMPCREMSLRSAQHKILFAKTEDFLKRTENIRRPALPDDSVHHRFVYALRRCEIALKRGQYIYADTALSEARDILLHLEAAYEGMDIHQFKSYDSLDKAFLEKAYTTYPTAMNGEAVSKAKNALLALYLDTVSKCSFLNFDSVQLKLLGCFD